MAISKPTKAIRRNPKDFGPCIPRNLLRFRDAEQLTDAFVRECADIPLPSLGQEFSGLRGSTLANALVRHRIVNKYDPVVIAEDSERAQRSIKKMLQFDKRTKYATFDYRHLSRDDRAVFLGAQAWLKRVLKNYRLPRTAERFPSGESVRTSGGRVSFQDKFGLDSQWTCNIGSLRYASDLAYNTLSLKRMVKARFRELYPYRFMSETMHAEGASGRETFFRMFKAIVDIETARITTVYKNADEERVISMEPTWAMICQLQCASALRLCLKREGIDLTHQADLNGAASALWHQSTIDQRNASNSNWTQPIKQLWPKNVVKDLLAFRSEVFEVPTSKGSTYETFNMLAPMGNGFTFEVMTMTLLSICRQFDPTAYVFGDDIIVNQSVHRPVMRFLCLLGWVMNDDKTFVEGNFRESCGSFWDVSAEPVKLVSFDFKRPVDLYDITVLGNKVACILQASQVCERFRAVLLKYYARLIIIMGESFLTPMIAFSRVKFPKGSVLHGDYVPGLREQLGIGMIYCPLVKHSTLPCGYYGEFNMEHVDYEMCHRDQYHRHRDFGMRICRVNETAERAYSETVRYATFLKTGANPTTEVRRTSVEYLPVDKFTGSHSSSAPLISLI